MNEKRKTSVDVTASVHGKFSSQKRQMKRKKKGQTKLRRTPSLAFLNHANNIKSSSHHLHKPSRRSHALIPNTIPPRHVFNQIVRPGLLPTGFHHVVQRRLPTTALSKPP